MNDNSNNVHFSGVRFICSPYLAIKSALASLGPIIARCRPQMNLRVMAIKKSSLGAQFFQRPLNCRVVCGTPFKKNIWVPIFSKNLPGTGSMYHTFSLLRSPTFCHILRVPGGVRHPSFVFIRQRVRHLVGPLV